MPQVGELLQSAEELLHGQLMDETKGRTNFLARVAGNAMAIVRRESGSWKWPLFMFTYMGALAYVASLTVYQVGSAFGWGLGV